MPELPEVEYATRLARRALRGKRIARVDVLHPSQRRGLPQAQSARLAGARVRSVERHGKHQIIKLDDGRAIVVHFRLTGDWEQVPAGVELPRFTRVAIVLEGGESLALTDPRALSSVVVSEDATVGTRLGPDPTDDSVTAGRLHERLSRRRISIKAALLDQGVLAGVGNIYASEALWYARVDPRAVAAKLDLVIVRALLGGIRRALARGMERQRRYYGGDPELVSPFNVYDREGRPCRRCGSPIDRMVQGARSTYWCPHCQRLR